MALSNRFPCLLQSQNIHSLLNQLFIFFLLSLPHANSISFDFSSFQPNDDVNITFQGDAYRLPEALQLTKDTSTSSNSYSVGRALYRERVLLWDKNSEKLTDFITHFSFIIKSIHNISADGLSFFIAPFGSLIPNNSKGGSLGLFSNDQTTFNATENQTVAVEFDTYKNGWDPSHYHIGIDVNSIVSKATLQQDDYLVTKSSDQIFFLSPNIYLRQQNILFVAKYKS